MPSPALNAAFDAIVPSGMRQCWRPVGGPAAAADGPASGAPGRRGLPTPVRCSAVNESMQIAVPDDATDEEVAAVVAAIELSWPRGEAPAPEPPRWRFAGRWWSKPLPLRRDRPW